MASLSARQVDHSECVTSTERSHEENQERAYIAASRRADRSIEARVQSARMASEIHKRRTGKAFRITEEIVMKEEMYEEEEDDFPRSYRLLSPNMQTSSAEMNNRVETYLTNRVAMSQLLEQDWRDNAINKAFAETFPNVRPLAQSLQSQRWSAPEYPSYPSGASQPQQHPGRLHTPANSSFDPNFRPVSYGSQHPANERSHSMSSAVAPADLDDHHSPSPTTSRSGSHPRTPHPPQSSVFNASNAAGSSMMDLRLEASPFTSELPAEAKMLLGGVDMSDSAGPSLYDQHWLDPMSFYSELGVPKSTNKVHGGQSEQPEQPDDGLYMNNMNSMDWESGVPPPPPDNWESFIVDNPWDADQQ
ncbi:hypothetical protein B0T10DRAFT_525097 [Thelonectria olida]|uniref:Uncharacterized protein n=1 Tax=Thelonectria olida TaxID=1576542 RepID=A0A9P8WHP9_9HYPO|nr:hypothetical protein B0T10DRAFT_525097 [Thelonectria olida]